MAAAQVNLADNQLCGVYTDPMGNLQGTYTAEGIKAIADSIAVAPSVTECNLRGNGLNEDSAKKLAKIGTEKRITLFGIKHGQAEADFSGQSLGSVDAILIANDLAVTPSLTKISLARNNLGEEGSKFICEAVKNSTRINELDLSGSIIYGSNIGGAAGAKHVADMLNVTASVTSVHAFGNSRSSGG